MYVDFDYGGHVERLPLQTADKLRHFEWLVIPTEDAGPQVFAKLHDKWYTLAYIRKVVAAQTKDILKFTNHMQVTLDHFGCWLWVGACSTKGYPMIRIGDNVVYARTAFFTELGKEIQPRMPSTCKNKKCMRPGHYPFQDPDKKKQTVKLLAQPHSGRRVK